MWVEKNVKVLPINLFVLVCVHTHTLLLSQEIKQKKLQRRMILKLWMENHLPVAILHSQNISQIIFWLQIRFHEVIASFIFTLYKYKRLGLYPRLFLSLLPYKNRASAATALFCLEIWEVLQQYLTEKEVSFTFMNLVCGSGLGNAVVHICMGDSSRKWGSTFPLKHSTLASILSSREKQMKPVGWPWWWLPLGQPFSALLLLAGEAIMASMHVPASQRGRMGWLCRAQQFRSPWAEQDICHSPGEMVILPGTLCTHFSSCSQKTANPTLGQVWCGCWGASTSNSLIPGHQSDWHILLGSGKDHHTTLCAF